MSSSLRISCDQSSETLATTSRRTTNSERSPFLAPQVAAGAAAVGFKPDHHQALGSLGYAYRQLGNFENALGAYDAALELNPDYAEAIEYRGEAYLGLNRINEAQNAYRVLFEKNVDLAAELLGSMEAWIEARRAEPAGVEVAQLDGFARWVEDRDQAATGSSLHKGRW